MRYRRGFTVLELVVAVAILAVIAGLAVTAYTRLIERQRLSTATRRVAGVLRQLRSLAVSGGRHPSLGMSEIRSAGIRLASPTRVVMFVDRDEDAGNGNDAAIGEVDLTEIDRQGLIEVAAPAGGQRFTFDREGTVNPGRIEVTDRGSGMTRAIELTAAGQVAIE